ASPRRSVCAPGKIAALIVTQTAPSAEMLTYLDPYGRRGLVRVQKVDHAIARFSSGGSPSMPNSFADFLAKLKGKDATAAEELFGRFTHQLIVLAPRNIHAALRHRVVFSDFVLS